nr:reverse transcriptase domain-containing protein [Tanacetum cinerariifolium]
PSPKPYVHDDPSVNRIHGSGSSSISIRVSEESSSGHSTMKSANICPLIDTLCLGLKVCPDKVDVVISLPSPKCLKDVQKLNGKLKSLNEFLAKSADKSLPFFKMLKKCTKISDFHWTAEAEKAFKQMKQLIAELTVLAASMEKEELIVYLVATKETVSAILMMEREAKQMP